MAARRGSGAEEQATAASRQCEAWLAGMQKIDFDKLSHTAQVDYILLRNAIERDLARAKSPIASGGRSRRPRAGNDIVGRPIGREALLAALDAEMIPYSPEQLVEMANREYAWCESEMKKASREMGFGDDWKKALEKVKTLHVAPGEQPKLIQNLANESIDYVRDHDLVTVPPLADETWRMSMLSPERQLLQPVLSRRRNDQVSFPTDTMSHDAKLQSLRGNNIHFSRATVHHELIPGHHLQHFWWRAISRSGGCSRRRSGLKAGPFTGKWCSTRRVFRRRPKTASAFCSGGCTVVPASSSRLVSILGKCRRKSALIFWSIRSATSATMRRPKCGDPSRAAIRPLYQAGYLIGAKQFWALRQAFVVSGKMTERAFHDAIMKQSQMPVEMARAAITDEKLTQGLHAALEIPRRSAGGAVAEASRYARWPIKRQPLITPIARKRKNKSDNP